MAVDLVGKLAPSGRVACQDHGEIEKEHVQLLSGKKSKRTVTDLRRVSALYENSRLSMLKSLHSTGETGEELIAELEEEIDFT